MISEFDNETDVLPYPEDGEAEDFTLMDVSEVLDRLLNNEFKPNCGLVVTDFLVRHGSYITPESDENYLEIVSRCHRMMPFPTYIVDRLFFFVQITALFD